MDTSEGCTALFFWLLIVLVAVALLVAPIGAFLIDREGVGWGYPLLSVGVFSYLVATFSDLDENKVFNMIYDVFISFATMLFLRDLFARDIQAELDLVLSIPVGLLSYFWVFRPLSESVRDGGPEFLHKGLGLLGNVFVNGLIYLILQYLLPA
jgi:hypothetical protein